MDDKKVSSTTQEKVSLVVPIAIIAAGIIIAGAILFNGARSASAPKDPNDPASQLTKGTISEEIGLDKGKFQECLTSGKTKAIVEAFSQEGIAAGIQGTPYSIIISKDGTQTVVNGAQPIDVLKGMVEVAIAGNAKNDAEKKITPVTKTDRIYGNVNADVKIVEYSDTECPYCQRFHQTMIQLMSQYNLQTRL